MKRPSVYRVFDKRGRLLYVGMSQSFIVRLETHRTDSHWFSDAARVDIEHFRTRQSALKAEALAIRTENPKHNIFAMKHRRSTIQ